MRFRDRVWGIIKAAVIIGVILAITYGLYLMYEYENSSQHFIKIAMLTHQKVNEQRRAAGLGELEWDKDLEKLAIMHSQDMANYHYIAHEGLNNEAFELRFNKVGISPPYAENCFYAENVYGEEELAEKAVQGWMNSPGHRANILNPTWTWEGIGVSKNGSEYYFTQDFR